MASFPTPRHLFDAFERTGRVEPGAQALHWQEGLDITLNVIGSSLTLLAVIVPLRADPQDDALLRKLLAHAFPGLRLRRGALTINPDENTLVFSLEQALGTLNKARFESLLANFAETALELRQVAQRLRFG